MRPTGMIISTILFNTLACGCAAPPVITPEIPKTTHSTNTNIQPSLTFTIPNTITQADLPTVAQSPAVSTSTPTFSLLFTETPQPTETETPLPTGELPGVQIYGSVTKPNGEGISGVQIYDGLAAYPGNLLATTDRGGHYQGFIYIPHDETVRVWAECSGYDFKPGGGNKSWMAGVFAWHHYGNWEAVRLDFIGTPRQ